MGEGRKSNEAEDCEGDEVEGRKRRMKRKKNSRMNRNIIVARFAVKRIDFRMEILGIIK